MLLVPGVYVLIKRDGTFRCAKYLGVVGEDPDVDMLPGWVVYDNPKKNGTYCSAGRFVPVNRQAQIVMVNTKDIVTGFSVQLNDVIFRHWLAENHVTKFPSANPKVNAEKFVSQLAGKEIDTELITISSDEAVEPTLTVENECSGIPGGSTGVAEEERLDTAGETPVIKQEPLDVDESAASLERSAGLRNDSFYRDRCHRLSHQLKRQKMQYLAEVAKIKRELTDTKRMCKEWVTKSISDRINNLNFYGDIRDDVMKRYLLSDTYSSNFRKAAQIMAEIHFDFPDWDSEYLTKYNPRRARKHDRSPLDESKSNKYWRLWEYLLGHKPTETERENICDAVGKLKNMTDVHRSVRVELRKELSGDRDVESLGDSIVSLHASQEGPMVDDSPVVRKKDTKRKVVIEDEEGNSNSAKRHKSNRSRDIFKSEAEEGEESDPLPDPDDILSRDVGEAIMDYDTDDETRTPVTTKNRRQGMWVRNKEIPKGARALSEKEIVEIGKKKWANYSADLDLSFIVDDDDIDDQYEPLDDSLENLQWSLSQEKGRDADEEDADEDDQAACTLKALPDHISEEEVWDD